MKRTVHCRPAVEAIEARLLPGGAAASLPAGRVAIEVASRHLKLKLSGTLSGTWSRVFTNPDVGGEQALQGTGKIKPLGQVRASGTLHTPGFIAQGFTTASLVLTSPHGTVTLSLMGTMSQPGFSSPATSLSYTIVKGTGRYAGASGSGLADFHEQAAIVPSNPPVLMSLSRGGVAARDPIVLSPTFTLTLHS
jgi:hypothetical protein